MFICFRWVYLLCMYKIRVGLRQRPYLVPTKPEIFTVMLNCMILCILSNFKEQVCRPCFKWLFGTGSESWQLCWEKGQGRFDYVLFQTFLICQDRKKSQFPECWMGPLGTGFKSIGKKEPQVRNSRRCIFLVWIGAELDTDAGEADITHWHGPSSFFCDFLRLNTVSFPEATLRHS